MMSGPAFKVREVTVQPIRSQADYVQTVSTINQLKGSEPGSPAGVYLDVLVDLINAYEAKHQKCDHLNPANTIEAISIRMENLKLNRADLGDLLNVSSGRVSEILNRNRKLTLPMIRTLSKALGLSYACLCQPYQLEQPGLK